MMNRCKKCGQEIDDYQYNNFNQMCPNCVRNIDRQGSPVSGRILQLTAEIQSRKENHWAFWMLLWFIVAGIIAMCMGGFAGFGGAVLFIGIGIFIVGILGTFGMNDYIKKTKEIQQTLDSLT